MTSQKLTLPISQTSPTQAPPDILVYKPNFSVIANFPGGIIACDTEGEIADYRDGRGTATGISLGWRDEDKIASEYYAFRHPEANVDSNNINAIRNCLERADAVVFHNAKHDLVALKTLGIDYQGKFYDTMLMAHWIDENLPSKALDALTKKFLNDAGKKVEDPAFKLSIKAWGWGKQHPALIREYAAYDADLTLRLFEHLLPEFIFQGFDGELWETEQKFIRDVIMEMESYGIEIDQPFCRRQKLIGQMRMAEIKDELQANPASGKDLEFLLLDSLKLPIVKKTPKGKPSFDKNAMVEYEALLAAMDSPVASLILEFRGWQKTCGANYEAYLKLVSPDGRLRPSYNLHRTVTGRLSTSYLHQIPKTTDKPWNGKLKKAFVPADGYRLWEADYSQLELRIAAAYCQDEALLATFAEDRDIFTEIAQAIGLTRDRTKTFMYATLYGAGIKRLASSLFVSTEKAYTIRNKFYKEYPKFGKVIDRATYLAENQGYVETWTKRRRHFDNPKWDGYKAFNAVIQGGGAEIVKRTMLRLREEVFTKPDEARMLLQIHDSIVPEIRIGLEDKYLPHIRHVMEDVQPDFGVKFKVDIHEWAAAA